MKFPIYNTKELSDGKTYDLNDPADRHKYFHAKLGTKIDDLKEYLDSNSFIGFMLAKKMAGKGTYSKLFQEIVGVDRVAHISVGDVVRDVHKAIENKKEREDLEKYLAKYYRSFISVEDALDAFVNRSQDKLIPTEFILTLVKREIEKIGKKALFIDGLPRSMDQVSYSLYFRDLINFRDEQDFFVMIDIPESVIDERMKYRRVCPICHTSRNLKLLPTKFVRYDKKSSEYSLMCDNQDCSGYGTATMVTKEGDDKGIALIKDRLEMDGKLINRAMELQGIPRILLRNAIPVGMTSDFVENYELTPEYYFEHDAFGNVQVLERPWSAKDDEGVESNSLLAAPVVVSLVDQIHSILLG